MLTKEMKTLIVETVRQELRTMLERALGGSSNAHAAGSSDNYGDDAPSSEDAEAYGPLGLEYQKRVEVGQSKDLAMVMAKISRGMDPTPLGFNFPPGASYFVGYAKDDKGVLIGGESFKSKFLEHVKDGLDENAAYVLTCEEFGLPTYLKDDGYSKIIAELPEKSGGAFALSAGDAIDMLSGPKQLGSGGKSGGKSKKNGKKKEPYEPPTVTTTDIDDPTDVEDDSY